MEEIKERFEKYLLNLHISGYNSTDKLVRSRYFNSKIEEFYIGELKLNPSLTRNELVIHLSAMRVKYQIPFVEFK